MNLFEKVNQSKLNYTKVSRIAAPRGRNPNVMDKLCVPSPSGKPKWNSEAIDKLLSNEKYTGCVLLQKTPTPASLQIKKTMALTGTFFLNPEDQTITSASPHLRRNAANTGGVIACLIRLRGIGLKIFLTIIKQEKCIIYLKIFKIYNYKSKIIGHNAK